MHQRIGTLLEDLADFNAHAKRQPYIVKRFSDDEPTSWDLAHAELDALLTELEARG